MTMTRLYRPEQIHLDQARTRLRDLEIQAALADLFDENAISEREVRDLWTLLHTDPAGGLQPLIAAQRRIQRMLAALQTIELAYGNRMLELFDTATAV